MVKTTSHILIVEDEEAHAELIRRAFGPCAGEYFLTVVNNLHEAWDLLTSFQPDLVIADLLLPDGRGIELLRDSAAGPAFPLVLMTSFGNEQMAVEALKAGALDYIVKSPPTFADMPHVVARALREWGHIVEKRQDERVRAAIYRISEAAHTAPNLDELYRSIHAIVGELMHANNFYIALYDPATDSFTFPYHADEYDPEWPSMPAGDSLTGYVRRTGQPLLATPEVKEKLAISDKVNPVGTPSLYWLGVPLKTQNGEIIGVMAVQTYTENVRLGETEKQVLVFISRQVGMAIERKRTEENLQRRAAELEAVNRISTALRSLETLEQMLPALLDEMLAVLDSQAGVIWLYEAASDHLRRRIARGWFSDIAEAPMSPGQGIVGTVFSTGVAYVVQDFAGDPLTRASSRSVIPPGWSGACVPIRTSQEVVGVLAISVPWPRELTEGQVRLLSTMAEIAGSAIQRTALYEQTHRQLEHFAALQAIDAAISSSLDLGVTLNVLLDQVTTQLSIDAADVLLYKLATQRLEYSAGRGFRSAAGDWTGFRIGEGLPGSAARERRTISISNLADANDPSRRKAFYEREGFVAYFGVPLIAKGKIEGVLELFHRTALAPDAEWLDFMHALAKQAAIAIDNYELFDSVQRSNVELALAYDETIEGWSRALDLRDKETEGHTQRVTEMTLRLSRAIGMSEADLVHIRRGALLHDIGKMGIPDSVLLKPGELTETEQELMQRHPIYAYQLLTPISYLRLAVDIPYCHHEKWDGTGYPRGLKGNEIPLAARVFAIVDVWDALRIGRPYHAAFPEQEVKRYLREQSGKHFDPAIVETFMQLIGA